MPAHLWSALDQMSSEMGVELDGLIAQAAFTLARLNGYVVPGKAGSPQVGAPKSVIKSSSSSVVRRPLREPEPVLPAEEPELPPEPEGNPFDHVEAGDEFGLGPDPEPPPPEPEEPPASRVRSALVLIAPGRDPFKMTTDSFTIGRGKTCDFVIDSNRVSREHCRIARDGNDFTLEDLNSSNGTFYGAAKEKVTRRKIKDGDEFTLGTEKIRFQVRR